ncbi:AEC family transporter [Salinibacterium sp. ZJ70]|uniref:AEC family transporter n=1 Tax=Salinibacterium sp. ZJ70 TaxID=2708084 RepID=UPI001423700A|nr:AEC family transporter [Salinibacterium sp. ZJ70]
MIGVLEGVGVIGLIVLVGYLCALSGVLDQRIADALTRVAFYVGMPAVLFNLLSHADLRVVFSDYMTIALASAAVVGVLFVVSSRIWFRRSLGETAIGASSTVFLNSTNMGIPVAAFVLDDPQAIAAVLVLQPILFTPGLMAVLDAAGGGRPTAVRVLTQPLKNPVVAATAAGVACSLLSVDLPDVVEVPVGLVADGTIAMVLLAFGISLRGRRVLGAGSDRVTALVATALKSVVMPLAAWLVAGPILGLDPAIVYATVVVAALPTGQVVYTYASKFRQGVGVARDVVLLTTVLAVPVLFIVTWLLHPIS